MKLKTKGAVPFLAAGVSAAMLATAPISADEVGTAAFTDVSGQYEEAVTYLVNENLATGLEATRFGVHERIKRGNAAVILAKALSVMNPEAPPSGFRDVPERAALAIDSLKAAGFISGKSAAHFGFTDPLTRGEVALMLADAYELAAETDSVPFEDVNSRYTEAVAGLLAHGVTKGKTDSEFGTDDPITRGEFAVFIHRAETLEADIEPVANVAAITETGVTVVLSESVGAQAEFSAEVIGPDGLAVPVVPAAIDEEARIVTLEFEAPLDDVPVGIWMVNGIDFNTSEEAAVKAVNGADSLYKLDVALRNHSFSRYNEIWLPEYEGALDGEQANAEEIQAIIDAVNEERVQEAYEEAVNGLDSLQIRYARLLVEAYVTDEGAKSEMLHSLAIQAALDAVNSAVSDATMEAALESLDELSEEFNADLVNPYELPACLLSLGGKGYMTVEEVNRAVVRVNEQAEANAVEAIASMTEETSTEYLLELLETLANRSSFSSESFAIDTVDPEWLEAYKQALLEADLQTTEDVQQVIRQVNETNGSA